MNEIPRCQKRKSDDQSPSDGRRPHHCVQSDEPTAETASSLGGAALFKDVWGTLVKAGWTSKRSSSRSLDSRYKYIRPGGRHDGEEGTNFLLGELAVLTYVKDICIIDSTVQGVYDQEGDAGIVRLPVLVIRLMFQAAAAKRRGQGVSQGLDNQRAKSTISVAAAGVRDREVEDVGAGVSGTAGQADVAGR
ncbi:hypothetical protein PC111_g8619 [Phytophthora cactorum]|nr:hypothetical protein PC111_g8619 [Phytophthora cactorum]KAG4055580.1 hypothetical protein PC123_g9323 [Phytophthora cactorum]